MASTKPKPTIGRSVGSASSIATGLRRALAPAWDAKPAPKPNGSFNPSNAGRPGGATPAKPGKNDPKPGGGRTLGPSIDSNGQNANTRPMPAAESPAAIGAWVSAVSGARAARDSQFAGITAGTNDAGHDYGLNFNTTLGHADDAASIDPLTGKATSQFAFDHFAFDPASVDGMEYGANIDGINPAAIDPQNPFSKMALLQTSYQQTKDASKNGYASMGQLYSGALLNKQSEDTRQGNINLDAIKRGFRDYLANQNQAVGNTASTYTNGVTTAWGNRAAANVTQTLGGS